MSPSREELHDLVAMYALGAVDADERDEVERAVAVDPELRIELSRHLEVLARLAPEVEAPPALLDRILAELPPQAPVDRPAPAPGPRRDAGGPDLEPAPVVSLDDERRARRGRVARAVLVGVAVVALLLVGVGLVRLDQPDSVTELAHEALEDPGADVVTLAADDGTEVARAAVLPDGQGYLVLDEAPDVAADETLQLWRLPVSETDPPISLGLVPVSTEAVTFRLGPDAAGVALSREPAGGSVAPTAVVAAGLLAS